MTQDREVKGMSVAGQLLITNNKGATPPYVDEELVTPNEHGSPILRAVTDEAQGPALLAITNPGSSAEEVKVQCLGEQKQTQPASLKIAPWATSITNGCSGGAVADFDAHLQAIEKASGRGVQGFEITGSTQTGVLAAFALAPHQRNGSTLFSAIPFFDPGLVRSPNIVFGSSDRTAADAAGWVYVPRLTFMNFAATRHT